MSFQWTITGYQVVGEAPLNRRALALVAVRRPKGKWEQLGVSFAASTVNDARARAETWMQQQFTKAQSIVEHTGKGRPGTLEIAPELFESMATALTDLSAAYADVLPGDEMTYQAGMTLRGILTQRQERTLADIAENRPEDLAAAKQEMLEGEK